MKRFLSWMNYGIIWEIPFHGTLSGFCLRPVTSDISQKSPEVTEFLEKCSQVRMKNARRIKDGWLENPPLMIFSCRACRGVVHYHDKKCRRAVIFMINHDNGHG
jgi:hypothetical protein